MTVYPLDLPVLALAIDPGNGALHLKSLRDA